MAVFVLLVTVLPVLIGSLFYAAEDRNPYALIIRWSAGFTALMAMIYFPALAGIFFRWSLTELTIVWIFGAVLLLLGAFYKNAKKAKLSLLDDLKALKGITIWEIAAFLLSAAHAVLTFFMQHVDDDDSAYVSAVTTSIDTNTLMMFDAMNGDLITNYTLNDMDRLVTSPQFAFYAVLSRLTGVRPAVLCHTLMPPVLTVLFFSCFLLIGYELFQGDRKKTGIFSVLAFLVSYYSYFSECTAGTFILIRSWQGKTQVVGLVIPLLLYLFLRIAGRGRARIEDYAMHVALIGAACLMSSIGGVFALGESLLLTVLTLCLTRHKTMPLGILPAYIFPAVMLAVYFRIGG